MINIGGNIGELYVGSVKMAEAYVGNQLVYRSAPEVLPYDAEVEWLGFNYNQAILTGLTINRSYLFELKVSVSSVRGGTENQNKIFSTRANSSGGFYELEIQGSTNLLRPRYAGDKTLTSYAVVTGTDMVISLNTDGQYIVNGEVVKTVTRNSTTISKPFYLGANLSVQSTNGFVGKYYYFKLTTSTGELLFDAIPVRVGTVGYLYDRVSRTLFGNAGSGSFTLGADV